jgi:hypothetical protein
MDSNLPNQFRGLREIRNGVLLLSLGNTYLCEAPFLKKIGKTIHTQIDGIKGDILALKDQFPGKFVDEIDAEMTLEEINAISLRLQNPDQELNEKCTIGELGTELETHLEKLTATIGAIRDQVEGAGLSYTRKDFFRNIFGGARQPGGRAFTAARRVFKLMVVFLALCVVAFFSLYFTMEDEEDLRGKIAAHEAHIRSQQEIMSGLDREMQQLTEETAALDRDDVSRQERLERIELNVQIHDLEQRRQKVQLLVQVQLDEIRKHRKEIKEMKKKSFLQRLLRQ